MKELNRKNIEDVAALTSMQEGMLFHYLKDPGSDAYFEQLSLRINGRFDNQIFKQAWNVVIRCNEMLRTVFRWENVENPIQIVLKDHQFQSKYCDFSGKEVNEAARALEEIKIKDKKKKFDLHEVPFRVILCKIQESKYEMIVSNHHILYDGWSNGIILKEFFETYEALICMGHAHQSREHPKAKFKEFIKWHLNRDIEKEEKFWRSYFQGIDTQIGLSVKRSKRRNKTCPESHQVRFEREDKDRIKNFVKRHKLTLASLFYSAWGLLLQKYNSSDDVIFGTTVSGRTAKIHGIEDIVGLFINTLPLRVQTTPGETIKDLLHRVDNVLRVREEFENSSLVDIRKYSDIDTKGELFDSIVILENYPLQLSLNNWFGEERGRLSVAVESYSMVEETHYDLTLMIRVFDELEVSFIYNEGVFDDECIVNMSNHFMKIIRQMATNPIGKVSDLEIITREEKNRILYDFNNTGANFPETRTIHQLFEEQAKRAPVRTALIGTSQEAQSTRKLITITYSELNERFGRLARLLQEKGVGPDTIVAIMMERSVEMIIGILGILKAGGAYLPIDSGYPEERINYMLKDSNAGVLLTTSGLSEKFEKLLIVNCQLLIVNEMAPNRRRLKNPPEEANSINNYQLTINNLQLEQASLAYIIYTSGSTGSPKGVLVEHRPLVNLLAAVQKAYPFRESDTYLLKTSYSFDVSVTELFGWFWQGGKLAVLEAGGEKDTVKIIDTIERFSITHINFVPSMFNIFVEQLLPSDTIKLSCLKYIFLAGEAVLAEVINKFRHLNTAIVLENIYGPTEGTVYSSKYSLSHWDGIESIPIGKPLPNIQLYIVNKNHYLQPVGIPGELVISGVGLARGYLNNPELTNKKFCLRRPGGALFEKTAPPGPPRKNFSLKMPGKNDMLSCNHAAMPSPHHPNPPFSHFPIYLTGDLARWLPDGNIEFLGRMDQQVKVRGFRIELGEIENHLLVIEEIKKAVVLAREDRPGDKYLCAYIVSQGELQQSILRDHLSLRLPDFMIPSYFVQLEEIPLTPNGKVDRKALPAPGTSVKKDYAAPRDEIEKKLSEIWSNILCCTSLGIDDNFFELGGHSLNATRLVSRIHKELNVMVPLQQIFISRTIRGLASYLKGMKKSIYFSVEMKEKWEYYPLSPAQERMYILHQANPDQLVYNMPKVMVLEGELEKGHIEVVFQKLIQRHESLRTSFHLVEEVPVQVVHEGVEFEIQYYELQVAGASERCRWEDEGTRGLAPLFIKNFIRPFDLSKAPLLRVGLIELPHTPATLRAHPRRGTYYSQEGKERKHILMLDMHHIISDGVSIGVFIRDFMAVYSGKELGPIGINYKDFSCWQNSSQWQEIIKTQGAFWLKQFEDEIPVLNLPLDYIPPKMQCFEGHTLHFELGREDTESLNFLIKREGITLYMTLLAAFNILVGKLSGQDDILVGTPSGGRKHPDLENIMGMFVNTLVLRSFPAGYKTISDFLKEIREISLRAFENRDYPFEELVRNLVKERDASRNPLFDVMFTLQDLDIPFIRIPGLTVISLEYDIGISKFDLTIISEKAEEKMLFTVEYCTRLFKETTIKRFIRYFKTIVSQVIRAPGISISEIELMSEEEKEEILFRFNDTWVDYPVHKTIYQLFEEQVQMWPDKIAVSGPGVGTRFIASISYRELNETSNQRAHLLRQKGVKPDAIVGLMMERSVEMIIGILGISKAGKAYLPIDPDYPGERINYMLKDSNAKILMTDPGSSEKFKKLLIVNCQLLIVNEMPPNRPRLNNPPKEANSISNYQLSINNLLLKQANLAYIIYTSGSTGKPKGVMVQHRNVIRLVKGTNFIDFRKGQHLLMTGYIVFDITTFEIWGALLNGLSLYLADKEVVPDVEKLRDMVIKNNITVLHLLPQLFYQVMDQCPGIFAGLEYFLVGGDWVRPQPINRLRNRYNHLKIIHCYGPTENTTFSTAFPVDKDYQERIPIGKPIQNSSVYILDRYGKLQPIGAPGELCAEGDGVARGYLNNPELTNEKFCLRRPGGRRMAHGALRIAPIVFFALRPARCALRRAPGKNFLSERTRGLAPLFLAGTGKNDMQSCNHASMQHHSQYPIPPFPHCPIYLTGDLARWLWDGNIEFLGRMDSQVKIRGMRIELGEIENQLQENEQVKEAVVTVQQHRQGEKYLCAYYVSGKELDDAIIKNNLSHRLPGYMIPSYFVRLERIPLTHNGKIDLKALPVPGFTRGDNYIAPGDRIEKKLVELWSTVLGVHVSIGIDDNFFELGGHSLKATILTAKVHQELGVKVPLAEIFMHQTIRELSAYIKGVKGCKQEYISISPVEKKDYYILSSAQRRLYVLDQLDKQGIGYNLSAVVLLEGEFDLVGFKEIFPRLISGHETLRTSFHLVDEVPVQVVHHEAEFEMEYDRSLVNGQGRAEVSLPIKIGTIIREFVRPFDLSRAPLLRVGLIELPHTPAALRGHPSREGKECKYILMVDMHHIITDGTSLGIIINELIRINTGEELLPLKLQYKDYSEWQHNDRQEQAVKVQEKYWLKQFAGDIPVLNLPHDYPRPQVQGFAGGTIKFKIGKAKASALKALTLQQETTLYMLLLSIYYVFLAKLSGQEDIVVGTPTAGRRHADLQQVVGMFVNTLALRNFPSGDKAFKNFLEEVKQRTLEAYENQEYQFEALVKKVVVERDASRNPLFDTMFALQNLDIPGLEIRGLKVKPYDHETGTAVFDLVLEVNEAEEGLLFKFSFSTGLFREETLQRFVGYFKRITAAVSENSQIKLSQIEMIPEEEKKKILVDFNDTEIEYPKDKSIHQLFEEQAKLAPDRTALIATAQEAQSREMHFERTRGLAPLSRFITITYSELNERSNQLAHLLREKGVQPDTIVGIMKERSLEMIIGIIGILKAGGAYLPIDPDYPEERIDFILKDSGAKILVTDPGLSEKFEKLLIGNCQLLIVNEISPNRRRLNTPPQEANSINNYQLTINNLQLEGINLAYIIYTSGTTGQPKGVMTSHANVTRVVRNTNYIRLTKIDRVLQLSSYAFDGSVFDIYGALLNSAVLVMIKEEDVLAVNRLSEVIKRETITVFFVTTALFNALVDLEIECFKGLRKVLFGGEQVSVQHSKKALEYMRKHKIIHVYGPTETTVYATYYYVDEIDDSLGTIPIGKPIANTTVYILDKYLNPVPIGVIGELYIGGDGTARGYLNRPELTANKFLPVSSRFYRSYMSHLSYIYRTGDLARWLPDGNIRFIGRIDHQIKIRGFRVELEEIQSQLLKYPGIKKAVVISNLDKKGDRYICAYIAARSQEPGARSSDLREYLSTRLPGYMIPSYFVRIDKIPLTPNGKLDKKALPQPGINTQRDYMAPRNEIEERLLGIWTEILGEGIPRIGIDDNFFELGGHSLKATFMLAKIRNQFDIDISLAQIFKKPTIRGIASLIKAVHWAAHQKKDINQEREEIIL